MCFLVKRGDITPASVLYLVFCKVKYCRSSKNPAGSAGISGVGACSGETVGENCGLWGTFLCLDMLLALIRMQYNAILAV